ncbi:MAG: DUF2867 domain-containing protein, partial [Gracilibacteraceae bacterium]|nr:DUF2867 domain-containing protein [Gracilibacteraceae bacterium]
MKAVNKRSLLNQHDQKCDYIDSCQVDFADYENIITSVDIGKAFLSMSPKLIVILMKLRNKIVRPFGLKTGGDSASIQQQLENFRG